MIGKGCGNDGLWTARKTRNGFSIAAHEPVEIAAAISTFPQPRPRPAWKSGNPKTGFPLSHALFIPLSNQNRKETQSRLLPLSFRLISGLEYAILPWPALFLLPAIYEWAPAE